MHTEISSLRELSSHPTKQSRRVSPKSDRADPGRNIMISDDDEPILMDFGSTIK